MSISVDALPDFNAGQTQTLHVTVSYSGMLANSDDVTVTINNLNNVTLPDAQKTVTIPAGNNKSAPVTFDVKATSNVQPGQTANGGGTISATDSAHTAPPPTPVQFQAIIHGPDAAPSPTATTVTQVTGTVKDRSTGTPVANAQVTMQDDARHTYQTGTDKNGGFNFQSTASSPISAGTLVFIVVKDGYDQKNYTQDAKAGQSVNVAIVLAATASASAAAPSDTAAASVPPTDSAAPVVNPTAGAAAGGSGGGGSSIFIVMGGILVLLGIGAIGLILWRRKSDNTPPDDDEPQPARRGPTPVPASRGAYRGAPADATSVVPRSGGYSDPTMVSRNPAAEAPTMMHRPVADEYPDPYGAPDPRSGGGYGGQTQYQGGYGSPAGYSEPTRYDPNPGGGYGSGQGGYGGQGGYDQGGYQQRPASDPYSSGHTSGGGYGADHGSSGYGSSGGYGSGQGGYDQGGGHHSAGGYQQQQSSNNAYGSGQGYQDQGYQGYQGGQQGYQQRDAGYPSSGGGYGSQSQGYGDQRGGGEHRGGHQGGDSSGFGEGYDQRGGYQQPRGGYQQPRGGYDQQAPEQRRSLDWLDD